MELEYVVEPEPLGTGGAIGFAARTATEGRVLVGNGDILTALDIGDLVAAHERNNAAATIALTPVADPSRYGLVRTDDNGAVLAFLEKPKPEEIDTNLINAGTYILEPRALALIPASGACSIERDIFPKLVGDGLFAYASDADWKDIGTVTSYLAANMDMVRGLVAGAGVVGGGSSDIVVDASATVGEDATIHSPVYIGPGCSVAAGATVGPYTVLAEGVQLEAGARAVRSVVLERAVVEREAQIADSIVGEDAVIAERSSVVDGAVIAPGATSAAPVVRGS
jgi:mannose-1-phosphate guanylyltransferase